MITLWKITPALSRLPLEPGLSTLNQVSARLPQGVYTTLRTYRGKPFALQSHLDRLEESAALSGQPIQLDRTSILAGIQAALSDYSDEARLRLTVDLASQAGTVYLTAETLQLPPPEAYQEGVSVITYLLERQDPLAKKTGFILVAEQVRRGVTEPVEEVLLVSQEGLVLEGLTSNFFAVEEGILRTAGEGVLAGITRKMVLELTEQEGILFRLEAVRACEIANLEEAFITSSSRSILPVRQINGLGLKYPSPGPITRRLMAAFDAFVGNG